MLDLLSANHEIFLWDSPLTREQLRHHDLVQRICTDAEVHFKDTLIYRKGMELTALEQLFLEELHASRRRNFEGVV